MKLLALLSTVLMAIIPSGHAHAATKGAFCPQWQDFAKAAGWTTENIPVVDKLMHRESRCRPMALNSTLNKDGSSDYGLMQINDKTWCLPSRYSATGYLQARKIIKTCKDLLDPQTNLIAALAVYQAADNSFSPWGL